MSDPLLMDVRTKPREETVTKPATRWRNWWRLYAPTFVRCNTCMTIHRSAERFFDYDGCCSTYETEFEAKVDAKEDFDESCDQAKVEYLGAYPTGATP